MPRAKKVLKEVVLNSDTDEEKKQETPEVKDEKAADVITEPTPTVPEEVKAADAISAKLEKIATPLMIKVNTPPKTKAKKPRAPRKPRTIKPITQEPPKQTEAQIRAQIEKEYKAKAAMEAKIRRQLRQEMEMEQAELRELQNKRSYQQHRHETESIQHESESESELSSDGEDENESHHSHVPHNQRSNERCHDVDQMARMIFGK